MSSEDQNKEQSNPSTDHNDMKSNFLALVSHEIRTPLQSVFSLLELIAEEKPDEKILGMANTAKKSASHMLEMIDSILDYAKIDADMMILDDFEVPVRTLVQGVIEALQVKTIDTNIKLDCNIDDDVPYIIIGDPQKLRQILINLTGNALKFTKEGFVTINVSTKTQNIKASDDKVSLRFEVVDSGIGISETAQQALFEPFTQAENSTSREYGGTGLGLSISKKLVDLMGGQIGVESKELRGSKFWFEIENDTLSLDGEHLHELPSLDGLSILSVEDHPQGAHEIKRSLESMGAKVTSCSTYKDGLEAATNTPFDVAIVDQGLPDGLGIDLIQEISEYNPYQGIIMYTARDDEGMQIDLKSKGVPLLTKPASRYGLGLAVKEAASQTIPQKDKLASKILIVEDTETIRDVLSRQLVKMEVKADFVDNGHGAIAAINNNHYGLVITDLHMPQMNGYELAQHIRNKHEEGKDEHYKDLPVILLTADVQLADQQNHREQGFNECMIKPISLGQLKHLLIRWGILQPSTANSDNSETSTKEEKSDRPPAIDQKAIIALIGEINEDTYEMLDIFITVTQQTVERMQEQAANADYIDLEQSAHSLKGSSRSAGCNELGKLASEIQELARYNKPESLKLVKEIPAEMARIKNELIQMRN